MRFLIVLLLSLATFGLHASESVCYGTTGNGYLEKDVKLPSDGVNFVSYGSIPELAGRTYVHSKVRDTVIAAYAILEKSAPGKVYKYAETGFREGGEFEPHKTHQNGLSIDFMVPVINKVGNSVHLPTNPFNKYGYNIEFDKNGHFDEVEIDFEAMAAHLVALYHAAEQQGIGIWRVIFDPALQPFLYTTRHGPFIRENILIPGKKSWVRHDEHYHVDFRVPCKTL